MKKRMVGLSISKLDLDLKYDGMDESLLCLDLYAFHLIVR